MHYTCLSPPPEKRPKVWDCDDCLLARGKTPNQNVRKRAAGMGQQHGGEGAAAPPATLAKPPIIPKISSR